MPDPFDQFRSGNPGRGVGASTPTSEDPFDQFREQSAEDDGEGFFGSIAGAARDFGRQAVGRLPAAFTSAVADREKLIARGLRYLTQPYTGSFAPTRLLNSAEEKVGLTPALRRIADYLERSAAEGTQWSDASREALGAPEGLPGAAGAFVAEAAPVVAEYGLAGRAVEGMLRVPQATALADLAKARGAPEAAALAKAAHRARLGAQLAGGAPITALTQGTASPEESLAGTAGQLAGDNATGRFFTDLSTTAPGRIATGIVGDVAGTAVVEGLVQGGSKLWKRFRGTPEPSLEEAVNDVIRREGVVVNPTPAPAQRLLPPGTPAVAAAEPITAPNRLLPPGQYEMPPRAGDMERGAFGPAIPAGDATVLNGAIPQQPVPERLALPPGAEAPPPPLAEQRFSPEGRMAIVVRSAQEPGRFQASFFHDTEGMRPFQHFTADTPEEALQHAAAEGFDLRSPPAEPRDRARFDVLADKLAEMEDIRTHGDDWTAEMEAERQATLHEMRRLVSPPDEPPPPPSPAMPEPPKPKRGPGGRGKPPLESARDAKGRLVRDLRKVSDDGLIREQMMLMDRMGQNDAAAPWLRQDDYGQVVSGFKRGRSLFEGDAERIQKIDAILKQRGWSSEDVSARAEALLEQEAERAGMQGQYTTDVQGVLARSPASVGLGAVGATAGYQKGDTEEERRHNALVWGVAALGLGYAGSRAAKALAKRGVSSVGLNDPAVKEVLSGISMTAREEPKGSLWQVATRAYREVFDKLYELKQFGREVGGSNRLTHELVRSNGWQGAAHDRLETSYARVVQAAKGIEPQVAALAAADRAIELDQRFPGVSKGFDLQAATRAKARLEQIPEVKAAANQLRGYYRELLDHQYANGVLSRDDYTRLTQAGQYYIPFVRDFVDEMKSNVGQPQAGLLRANKGMRKMTDEEAEGLVRNPFLQAVADTYLTERKVAQQRVTNVLADIIEKNPVGAFSWLREIPTPKAATGEGRIIYANVKGVRKAYEVTDRAMWDALSSLARPSQDLAWKLFQWAKKAKHWGVTNNPAFTLSNAIRDQIQTAVQYPVHKGSVVVGAAVGGAYGAQNDDVGFATGAVAGAGLGWLAPHSARTLLALGDIVAAGHGLAGKGARGVGFDPASYHEFLREGGAGFGYYAAGPKKAEEMIRSLVKRGEFDPAAVLHPKSWLEAMRLVNTAIEEAPRLARYKYLLKQGASKAEGVAGARDISLDFARAGSGKTIQQVSQMTAFFNARLQGWDKLTRMFLVDRSPEGKLAFGKAQVKAWTLAAAAITAPSVALWEINKDDPTYQQAPVWEKNLFWLVPHGVDEDTGETKFWKIPKPFELGFAFASLPERFLDWQYQKNPHAFTEGVAQIATNAVGAFPLPDLITPSFENSIGPGGFSFFRAAPVVSPHLQREAEERQFDEKTSSLAIGASKLAERAGFHVSPQKVDNLIVGHTGQAGRFVADKVTDVARRHDIDERGITPAFESRKDGIFSRFETKESTPANVNTFYSTFDRVERVHNSYQNLKRGSSGAQTRAFVEQHRDELEQYARMRAVNAAIGKLTKQRQKIESSPSLSPGRRAALISKLNDRANRLAEIALDVGR